MSESEFKWNGISDKTEGGNALLKWKYGEVEGTFDPVKELHLRATIEEYEDFSQGLVIEGSASDDDKANIIDNIDAVMKDCCDYVMNNSSDSKHYLKHVILEFYKRTYGLK